MSNTVYSVGTVTVTNGGTTVTGSGTRWVGVVYEGDLFTDPAQGLFARVTADATDDESLSINPWPGTALAADAYEVLFTSDAVRQSERTRQLLEQLSVVQANGRGLFDRFDDGTVDSDPGSGRIRLNNADPSLATAAYIDNLDANGATVSAIIDTWDDTGASDGRGQLWLRSIATPSTFHAYDVTGSVVDGTGYRKLTLEHIGGSGSFAAGDELMVMFNPIGQGEQGDPGLSAYEVAVAQGFVGDEAAWLASLEGTDGIDGTNGTNGVDGTGLFSRVRAVATANITISTALNNGDSIDGVTLATNDLVLVTGQTAPAENGIYVVGAVPARDSSFDTYDEHPGVYVSVMEGAVNADTLWRCTSNKGGTLGTTALTFTQFTSGLPSTAASAAGPASIQFAEDTDNGSNKVTLQAPSALSSDVEVTLPDKAGSLGIITPWASYTPASTQGLGTVSSVRLAWRRVGDTCHIRGDFTTGTTTANEARLALPDGLTSDATKVPVLQGAGTLFAGLAGAAINYALIESGVGYLTFGFQNTGNAALTKQNGNSCFGSSTKYSLLAEVPISGW